MKKSLLDLVAILLLAPVGLVLIAYSAMAAGRSSTIAVASTDLEEHRQRRWLSVRNRRRACRDGLCPARFDCYLMSGHGRQSFAQISIDVLSWRVIPQASSGGKACLERFWFEQF